jgi:hypothetical protein
MMEEREKIVCLAKLAEQAERYDGKGSHPPVPPCSMLVLQCRRSWRPCISRKSVLCSFSREGIERRWPSIRRVCISLGLLASRSEYRLTGCCSDFFTGFLPYRSENPLNV